MVLVVGTTAALAVVVALAPTGALARARFRRHRPGVLPAGVGLLRPPRAPGSSPGARPVARTALVAVERLGGLLRHRLGRSSDPDADRRLGATVTTLVATGVLVSPIVAVPVAAVVWAVPMARRRARRLARERDVRAALPDAVDLFRLAVGAGLSVHQAVDAVAECAPAAVARPLTEARRRVELGERLGDALSSLDDLGDAGLPLVAALPRRGPVRVAAARLARPGGRRCPDAAATPRRGGRPAPPRPAALPPGALRAAGLRPARGGAAAPRVAAVPAALRSSSLSPLPPPASPSCTSTHGET